MNYLLAELLKKTFRYLLEILNIIMKVYNIKINIFYPYFGGTNIYSTSFNFSNYVHKIYKNVVIGGSGRTSIINSGQNISIRATDLIQLDEGFEVKTGAIFHADINPCNQ